MQFSRFETLKKVKIRSFFRVGGSSFMQFKDIFSQKIIHEVKDSTLSLVP